jgi:chromosome transmission fidelity protein 18
MSFNYPSDIPSDFDPAIHLHSDRTEPDQPLLDPSFSEDLVAAEQQALENQIHKNQAGIVIQHRSWNIGQVFLSEDDHSVRR